MPTALTSISGIGPAAAEILKQHDFKSAEDIAATTVEQLSTVPGFGAARAQNTIQAAIELVSAAPQGEQDSAPADEAVKEKSAKKGKSKGKKQASKDKKSKGKKSKDKKKSDKKDKKKKDKKKKKKKKK